MENCCPQCGRTLASKKVESRELTPEEKQAWVRVTPLELDDPLQPEIPQVAGAGWLKGLHTSDHTISDAIPIKPKSNLKELEAELRSTQFQPKPPPRRRTSRILGGFALGGVVAAGVSLILFAAGRPTAEPSASPLAVSTSPPLTASTQITTEGLMVAIKSSKPGKEVELLALCRRAKKELGEHLTGPDRKVLQAAHQRAATTLASDQMKSAQKAVANKNWNRAVSLAEASLALNQEVQGPKQQRQQAKALIATVEENLRNQRLSNRSDGDESAGGAVGPAATMEVPSLGEGSDVPVAARGSGRAPAGAPAPTQIQPVQPTKPAKPVSQPVYSRPTREAAPDLGNRGVLPGYNTKSQYK